MPVVGACWRVAKKEWGEPVVLEVPTHAGGINAGSDPVTLKFFRIAYARVHQEVGG